VLPPYEPAEEGVAVDGERFAGELVHAHALQQNEERLGGAARLEPHVHAADVQMGILVL